MKTFQSKSGPKSNVSKTLRQIGWGGGTSPQSKLSSSLHQNLPISPLDILVEDHLKLLNDPVTLQRGEQLAVDIHRRLGLFERSWQRDADIGMLRLARPV